MKQAKMLGFAFSLVLLMSAVLMACGAKGGPASNAGGEASGQPAATTAVTAAPTATAAGDDQAKQPEERTVTDAMGHEVTVPANPQRILAPFLEDPLAAMGIKPVAQWSANQVPQQYLQSSLQGVPLLDMNGGLKPEQALSFSPDLIVFMAPTYIANGTYDDFAKIAPTFVLAKDESDWRVNLQALGELLGKADTARQALADYDRKLAETKQKLQQAVGDKTVAILQAGGEKGYKLFGDKFYSGELLYGGLGFKEPKLLKGDYETYSLETLSQLDDVDCIFVISGKGRLDPPVDNPLWQGLPAVKQGHVYKVDSGHWFNANVIANGLIMDDVLKDLAG